MTPESLKRRLEHHDQTMAWLARRLGVTRTTVWRWCQGETSIPSEYQQAIDRHLPAPLEAA